jgi:hypothetical protein
VHHGRTTPSLNARPRRRAAQPRPVPERYGLVVGGAPHLLLLLAYGAFYLNVGAQDREFALLWIALNGVLLLPFLAAGTVMLLLSRWRAFGVLMMLSSFGAGMAVAVLWLMITVNT